MKICRKDGSIQEVTFEEEEGKSAFWHTTAHILAQAVKRLYPNTKCAIGPSIAEGFYYDFDFDFEFFGGLLRRNRKRNEKNCERKFAAQTFEVKPGEGSEPDAPKGRTL